MIRIFATAAVLWLCSGAAKAEQHIACPAPAAQLESVAPVLGPLVEPLGELREGDLSKRPDGAYVVRYDLSGGDGPKLEKWLICRYRGQADKSVRLPAATKECRVIAKPDGTANAATGRPYYRVLDVTCSQ